MKVIHIYPKIFSFLTELNRMELLLYHEAASSEDYRNFFKENKNYKILDNSFYELRKEVSYENLIEIGKEIGINEIILPDKLWDGEWTRNAVEDNLKNYYNEYKKQGWKVAAVLQGKNEEDINITLNKYINNEKIDVIMLPRKLIKEESWYAGRLKWWLNNHEKIQNKEIHFLGANSWGDFHLPLRDKIRSIDTKLFTKTLLHEEYGVKKWKKWDDEFKKFNLMRMVDKIAILNIHTLKNYYGEV